VLDLVDDPSAANGLGYDVGHPAVAATARDRVKTDKTAEMSFISPMEEDDVM
jgi:hypothetical protein